MKQVIVFLDLFGNIWYNKGNIMKIIGYFMALPENISYRYSIAKQYHGQMPAYLPALRLDHGITQR